MTQVNSSGCVVCGVADARALENVVLEGGAPVTLCGTHALMHRRLESPAHTVTELRELLANRRGRRDRRQDGDELGAALTAAFSGSRREGDRRQA